MKFSRFNRSCAGLFMIALALVASAIAFNVQAGGDVVETFDINVIAQEMDVKEFAAVGPDLMVFAITFGYDVSGSNRAHIDGQTLGEGAWYFPDGAFIVNKNDGAHAMVENEIILYQMKDLPPALLADNCNVTCGAGFYACCADVGGFPQCKCVSNSTDPNGECQSGGVGAVSCSLNKKVEDFNDLGDGGEDPPVRVVR